MTKLDKKIESIIYGNLDDFEIYDFEATSKHIFQIKKVIREEIMKKIPKKDMEHISYTGSFCFSYDKFQDFERQKEDWDRGIARNKVIDEFKSVIKNILD